MAVQTAELFLKLRTLGELEEIADQRIVYRKAREPIDFFRFAETAIIKKHLERMIRARIVREEGGRYRFLS